MRAERQPASVGGSMVQCAAMPAPLKGRFQAPKGRLWGVLMPPPKALAGVAWLPIMATTSSRPKPSRG